MAEPKSIFELGLFESKDEAQSALDVAPFDAKGLLHLPELTVLDAAVEALSVAALEQRLDRRKVLHEYQRLAQSARSSLIICGQVSGGHRCGGIMDIEVTPFGAYYQCRSNTSHRFAV